jgi:hypothetical protein
MVHINVSEEHAASIFRIEDGSSQVVSWLYSNASEEHAASTFNAEHRSKSKHHFCAGISKLTNVQFNDKVA